jgi:hypothetical protein
MGPNFGTVFASLVQLRAGGLVVGPDALFNTRSERLAALAMHYAVPAIYQYREFAAAGGLMSYGTDIADTYARSASIPAVLLRARSQGSYRSSKPPKSS